MSEISKLYNRQYVLAVVTLDCLRGFTASDAMDEDHPGPLLNPPSAPLPATKN